MLGSKPGLQIGEASAELAPGLCVIEMRAYVADRQPAVLFFLGDGDGLAADCRGHDGADSFGGVRGLLE